MTTRQGDGLWCPIVARCAGQGVRQRAQDDTIAWVGQVGLARSQAQLSWAAAWNVAEFAGRVYGDAQDLSLAAEWIAWMDIIDDFVETLTAN